jgi:DNA-binding transcriptional MerR regulator
MRLSIKPAEASKILGVSYETLKNWDNKGILESMRTPTNRRYYTRQQLNKFLNIRNKKRGQSELKFAVDTTLYQDLKERAYESKKSMADYIRGILINDLYGISDTDTSSIKQTKLIKKLDHACKQFDGISEMAKRLNNIEGILSDVMEEESLLGEEEQTKEPANKEYVDPETGRTKEEQRKNIERIKAKLYGLDD